MRPLADKLNTSRAFNRLLSFFSSGLARYRGVPILAGVILVVISFVVHLIAAATRDVGWQVLAFSILHLAIFLGLLGVLLAEPVGRG